MSRRARARTHAHDDQYGERGRGDDRDARDADARGGGGGARARGGAKGHVTHTRRVPKFLAAHAALLGARDGDDGARGDDGDDGARGDDATTTTTTTTAAPRRAALRALGFDDDDALDAMAATHKADGNRAFEAGRYEDAAAAFTRAAALRPKNWVYASNRSAAYGALGRWEDALVDAEETVRLNGEWAKGYARLATARAALGRLSDATAAWRRACALDDANASLKASLAKAEAAEASSVREGKFTFQASKRKAAMGGDDAGGDDAGGDDADAKKKKKKAPRATLSFADDDA